uniref:HNH endonuclease n=1 Tax=Panagrellus redivivus TaxID=6233 RepID=A0A7E5A1Y1_PANRE
MKSTRDQKITELWSKHALQPATLDDFNDAINELVRQTNTIIHADSYKTGLAIPMWCTDLEKTTCHALASYVPCGVFDVEAINGDPI